MCDDDNSTGSCQGSKQGFSRRTALTTGLSTTAALTLPGVAAAGNNKHRRNRVKETSLDIQKESILENDDYVLRHYTVDTDELLLIEHLTGEKEGKIAGIPLDNGGEYSVNDLTTAKQSPELFIEPSEWMDYIVEYDRYNKESTYEVCESSSSYGVHLYSGFTVYLAQGVNKIGQGALGAIIDYLLEPLGIPGVGTAIGIIVGYITDRNFQEMTWIFLDSDGLFNVRNMNIRYNNIYDANYDNTSYRGSIPGHLD